jgi:hypothetical protein
MLGVIMLNVVMLSVAMLSVVMLSVLQTFFNEHGTVISFFLPNKLDIQVRLS